VNLGIAGKTALVTASTRGLGRASAVALAREGANVAVCGRDRAALQDAEDELLRLGVGVLAVPADLDEPDAGAHLVRATSERFGRLDILVANNGGPRPGRALELSDDDLAVALNSTMLASIRLVREAVPHMQAVGWGRICLISSYSVFEPIPHLSASNTARSALLAWSRTAATDLSPDGIALNLACPGSHATDRLRALGGDLSQAGDPDDFGAVVAFLCSEHASVLTGVALAVDGGATALTHCQ
jgi:3-oxoacyl-[acyl-carrier protein] reductase